MLAFTETNAYQIYAIKNGKECVANCNSEELLILDSVNGNHCGLQEDCKIILFPDNICIDSCNTNLFTLNDDKKKCGLCKDLDSNKQYKLFGKEGCLADKFHNTYYLNEEMKLIDYCNKKCSTCDSFDNCTSCIDGYHLEYSKSVLDETTICKGDCKTCLKNDTKKCTSCEENKFLQEDESICVIIV